MDMLPSSFLPGDPRLINHIVYELKSQGIFDQFRKECIADVDTKPAYQNLSQRVEGSVMKFLKKQKFAESINKNQLREQLRKNITESGFLEAGVERIVDQVVNPKINSVFLPKVEDVVYRFLGIERPSQEAQQSEGKPEVDNLLLQDLKAASPKYEQEGKINDLDRPEATEALNSSEAKTEDESPSFELLEESKFSAQDENSDDSYLSALSGLSRSSKKINDVDMSTPVEPAQDISQQSEAVIASEEGTKMEICETTEISGASDNTMEKLPDRNEPANPPQDGDGANVLSEIEQGKPECKSEKSIQEDADGKKPENSKRSHDRHKSSRSDKREHKDKKERSKSESKSKDHKEKTSSKHSSTNKVGSNKKEDTMETDKSKKDDKERNKSRTSSSSKNKDYKNKSEKRDKSKEKSEKDKERTHKDKDRTDKDKSSVDKANKSDKSKSTKDKENSEKSRVEKATSGKDKSSKIAKEKSSNSTKTENKDKGSSSKEKGPPSSNMHSNPDKSSSKSSKDKPKSASTSNSKDKGKKVDDSKSKSTEKHKKGKSSSSSGKFNLSSRKDKEKKSSDDHYSFKDKKSIRRSTDRDSNDGSSKMNRHDSTTETGSNSYKGSSKESSEVFSSGGGESSNSENVEQKPEGDEVVKSLNAEVSPIKYLKPKFASNIHEAMKLMKIRKQLAKMERENQLALTAVLVNEKDKAQSGSTELKTGTILHSPDLKQSSKEPESPLKNILKLQVQLEKKVEETQNAVDEKSPVLKSHDISLESFAALEARLALEMSAVNYSSYGYGDDEDNVQYSSITTRPDRQRQLSEKQEIYHSLFEESAPNSREAQMDQPSLDQIVTGSNVQNSGACSQASKTRTFVLDQNSDEEIELAGGMQSKSRIREPDSILRTVLLSNEPYEIPAEKSQNSSSTTVDFLGFSNVAREDVASTKLHQLREQVVQAIFELECKAGFASVEKKSAAEQSSDSDHNFGGSIQRMNGKKLFISLEKAELDNKLFPLRSTLSKEATPLNGGCEPTNFKQNGQKNVVKEATPLKINRLVKEWENDDIPCCFLEKPDAADITNLNQLIERLAANIEKQLEKIANSSSTVIKRTCKRKLQEEERDIERKFAIKRRRLNELILDENMCNANLASHQNFNFPLSPAESEKSGDQKKDELTPVKPRKSAKGSTSQRYSTDELYKPRPVLGCSGSRRKCSRQDSMEQS